MTPKLPEDGSQAEGLLKGLLQEIAKFERTEESVPGQVAEAKAVDQGTQGDRHASLPLPFTHLRAPLESWNPLFLKGLEIARFAPEHNYDLGEITPDQVLAVAEVAKGAAVAVRDGRRKMDLAPGENLVQKNVGGKELYLAKCKGRLVVIGTVFHILPSDLDGRLAVHVSSDNMEVYLDVFPAYGIGAIPDMAMVEAWFAKCKIVHGIRKEEVMVALRSSREERRTLTRVSAALGSHPMSGTPGSVECFFDQGFQGPVNLTVGADGKIDFRNISWIPVVTKDQLLARVVHEVPAQDGMDVFGHVVPAQQPPKAYLVPGKNVRCDEQECEFYSEINGCVMLNGSVVDVMNVFVVNSDVDYHTGNIRFNGNVLITGGVTKGFEVEAEGDILILKGAEPCRIKAGRDLFIQGGLLGGGKGEFRMEAGRHLGVGYAENAWMEAQGDIRVENYALQSVMYSCGHIVLDKLKGSIIGGEAMAAKGLEAKTLGSEAGIKTQVAVGVNFVVKRRLAQLARQKSEIQQTLEKVDQFLKSLAELASHGGLPPSKLEALKTIMEKRKLMWKAHKALAASMAEMEDLLNEKDAVVIKVSATTHSEVVLSIQGRATKTSQTFLRSVFYLDPKGDRILRRPL